MSNIVSDSNICHGKPCFKGTRILVSTILDSIASDVSIKTLIEEYPPLTKEDIQQAILYASSLTKNEEYPLQRAM